MSSPAASVRSLVTASCLDDVAAELERTRWAANAFDAEWRLAWVSQELKVLLGEEDEEKLGYGRHVAETWGTGPWLGSMTRESAIRWFNELVPRLIAETPGGRPAVERMLAAEARPMGAPELAALEVPDPDDLPDLWASHLQFVQGSLPPIRINYMGARARDHHGSPLGTLFVYGPALPASVLTLVARGDLGMFQRMAKLVEPGRHRAAILFADLQSSSELSRRLPSAAYFKLICAATTAIDEAIVRHSGIVGKHAGDGVTAFFLADDLGGSSAAARAALDAARTIPAAAYEAAMALGPEVGLVDLSGYQINVGLHWGGALYMGQVVTGGRLEVTALGDEVNECARIQQSARDGALLASKALVERLEEEDARELDVDPDAVVYETLGRLPGATDKAVRDAGALPVTSLRAVDRPGRT